MNGILKIVAAVLLRVLELSSPEIVKQLRKFAEDFRAKCAITPNPWDDILSEAICTIVGV